MQRQFSRRLKKRTDYKQRLALLKAGEHRAVVRKSLNNIHVQIISYDIKGDRTVLENTSSNLKKLGWKAHCGSIPAAYLTGYQTGKKVLSIGVKKVIADIGLQTTSKENSLYAVFKGLKDSGVDINIGDSIPRDEKIKGKHIADYAKKLKSLSKDRYEKQFSLYIKNNLDPENLEKHFDEIKQKIK